MEFPSGLKKMVCRHLSLAFLQNLFTKQCLGRQIDEEEYKKKCGGGIIPPGEKCTKIDGIKRVKTSCADKETRPGGRCKLECEESESDAEAEVCKIPAVNEYCGIG